MATSTAAAVLETNLALVEAVIRSVCRHNRCPADEGEEFASLARLRLIENDYAVLRKFAGRASLKTYLTVVVQRFFLDFRIQKWGKWRPSAVAKRMGPVALRLEALLHRDHYTLAEAIGILRDNLGTKETEDELRRFAAQLPARVDRRTNPIAAVEDLALASPDTAEGPVLEEERERTARRLRETLRKAIRELSAEDRLVLRLRFEDGMTVPEIADALRTPARPLFRRIARLAEGLRRTLELRGIDSSHAIDALGAECWGGFEEAVAELSDVTAV